MQLKSAKFGALFLITILPMGIGIILTHSPGGIIVYAVASFSISLYMSGGQAVTFFGGLVVGLLLWFVIKYASEVAWGYAKTGGRRRNQGEKMSEDKYYRLGDD